MQAVSATFLRLPAASKQQEVSKVKKPGNKAAVTRNVSAGFSAGERAAMKERAKELKEQARTDRSRADGERDVLAKIAEMSELDRAIATRVHAIVKDNAPALLPKTWYSMPAYANRDGKVVCFFQSGSKFNTRYATLGFGDSAKLDDGAMWPTAFALTKITGAVEAKIGALVKKAAS